MQQKKRRLFDAWCIAKSHNLSYFLTPSESTLNSDFFGEIHVSCQWKGLFVEQIQVGASQYTSMSDASKPTTNETSHLATPRLIMVEPWQRLLILAHNPMKSSGEKE